MQFLQIPVPTIVHDLPRIKYEILLFDSLCQNKDNFCLNELMQQKMNKHKMKIGVNVPGTHTYKPIV